MKKSMHGAKILITGMHRSGTTLTYDLLAAHPDVKHIFNETPLLNLKPRELFKAKTLPDHRLIQSSGQVTMETNVERVDHVVDFDRYQESWGNKMSYPSSMLGKGWAGTNEDYINQWQRTFGEHAVVVHIIRHPFDIYLSSLRRWKDSEGFKSRNGEVTVDNVCRRWLDGVTRVLDIKSDIRIAHWLYEDVVMDTEKNLRGILEHCDLDHSEETIASIIKRDVVFFGAVNKSRAFNHMKHDEPLKISDPALAADVSALLKSVGYTEALDV